ncbi:hypothetical protein ACOMHN_037961 [Nucella lapillus]
MLGHPILWTAVVSMLLFVHQTEASISLTHLSTVYLPYTYGDSFVGAQYGIWQGAAHIATYDPKGKMIYALVGPIPDRLQITKDCSTIVVALENYHVVEFSGNVTNPPAGVGFIQFPNGLDGEPETQILDFKDYDQKTDELLKTGVRWIYRKDPLSDDLEPECVTFNADETLAYLSIQENNAIAVVDIKNPAIKNVYGLEFKDWSKHSIDPSDEDGGIHMKPWNIFGMYMPDSVQWFSWNGGDYIVSANEGQQTGVGNFSDSMRAYMISSDKFSENLDADLLKAVNDPTMLGRLYISTVDGLDADGKIKQIHAFGARSISIWRASDMALVYDSGSEITEKTIELRQAMFNNRVSLAYPAWSVQKGMDYRSDNAGEEPESVTVGEVDGSMVIFVGVEKPGMVAVYSIPKGDGIVPQFESLYTGGIPEGREDTTWPQLYHERAIHGVDLDSV